MTDFQETASWIAKRQRRSRSEREKIHRAYLEAISSGKTPDEARRGLTERFGEEFQSVFGRELTPRVIDNIVARPMGAVAESLTQATLIVKVQRLANSCEEQIQEIDDLLDSTDGQDPKGWVDVAQEVTDSLQGFSIEERLGLPRGKFDGTKTKRIPLSEYRQGLMERRHQAHLAFFEAVKALMPRDRVNIFVKDGDVSVLADQDLDRQLERFNAQRSTGS